MGNRIGQEQGDSASSAKITDSVRLGGRNSVRLQKINNYLIISLEYGRGAQAKCPLKSSSPGFFIKRPQTAEERAGYEAHQEAELQGSGGAARGMKRHTSSEMEEH